MSKTLGVTAKEQEEISNVSIGDLSGEKYPIGIKTPLSKGKKIKDTLFEMHYEILDQIKDNLKNLILTRKGERLGFADFGTNIHLVYSQDLSQDQISDFVMSEITSAVSKYMPALALENFYSKEVRDEEMKNNVEQDSIDFSDSRSKRADIASNFYSGLNNTKIGSSKIRKNSSKEIVYKISVEYSLPNSLTNKKQNLTIFLRKSVWYAIIKYKKVSIK